MFVDVLHPAAPGVCLCVCVHSMARVKCDLASVLQKFVRYYLERTTVGAQATQQRANERTAKQHSTNTAVQERPPFHLVLSRVLKKVRIITSHMGLNVMMCAYCQIIVYAISVFLVFSVTLSLFPAVLSQIESSVPNQHTWLG